MSGERVAQERCALRLPAVSLTAIPSGRCCGGYRSNPVAGVARKVQGIIVSVREKLAAARERERQGREAEQARQRRNAKRTQLEKLGVPIGSLDSRTSEETIDAMLSAEKERQTDLYKAFVRAGTVTTFRALGVQVLVGDDKVYTIGSHESWSETNSSRLLGMLAGAQAVVTDGSQAWSPGRAMFMPIALAGLATKTMADAAVVFPDGTVHTVALNGNNEVREAQKQVVQFNAFSGSTATVIEANNNHTSRLRKLQELREAGLLSQEEYEAKRTEIIASI